MTREQQRSKKQLSQIMADLAKRTTEALVRKPVDPKILFHHYRYGNITYLTNFYKSVSSRDDKEVLFIIVGDETIKSAGMFILSAPSEKLNALKSKVLELLAAKGGGKGNKIQGKFGEGILTAKLIDNLKNCLRAT